jgi:hypothetical protein
MLEKSQCKINPHQLSSFSVGLDTGITVGLIPGSIWKMSCSKEKKKGAT